MRKTILMAGALVLAAFVVSCGTPLIPAADLSPASAAVEVVVDRIGLERHELSGRAKDLGSAAVHLSLLQVPVVWALVYFG